MSAASVVAIVALLTAVLALLDNVRVRRRLLATHARVASINASLDLERVSRADAIAAVHRSTVDEVTFLLGNVLAQLDTEITAKVAEALAIQNSVLRPGEGGTDHTLTGTTGNLAEGTA